MSYERIQKVLARAGVASRRKIEKLISAGSISVNGNILKNQGVLVDPNVDYIKVQGTRIAVHPNDLSERVYFLLNKPRGVISTSSDDVGRKTVLNLIFGAGISHVYPVGRLDYDAEGALLLTNDGDLAYHLTHPKYHIFKVYEVKVKGVPSEDCLDKLRKGIYLQDGATRSSKIEIIGYTKVNTWLKIILTQGKNNQIKNMFWRIHHPVQRIFRTHFAGISIKSLLPGQFRMLTKKEITMLKNMR